MIQIDDKIVSTEIFTTRFCCDLPRCKGICCVEGNAGAPLEADEVDTLEAEYETYKPYMKPEGIEAVERQGFMVIDEDGDYTTPLIGEAECAYSFEQDGITFCAIEKSIQRGQNDVHQTDFVPSLSDPAHRIRQRFCGTKLPPLERLPRCAGPGPGKRPSDVPNAQGSSDPSFRGRVLRCTVFSSTIS